MLQWGVSVLFLLNPLQPPHDDGLESFGKLENTDLSSQLWRIYWGFFWPNESRIRLEGNRVLAGIEFPTTKPHYVNYVSLLSNVGERGPCLQVFSSGESGFTCHWTSIKWASELDAGNLWVKRGSAGSNRTDPGWDCTKPQWQYADGL